MSGEEKAKEVLAALSALSKESNLSLNELRVIIALERLVARTEAHKALRNRIIFKGGFVLLKVLDSPRFTRDLDAIGAGISIDQIVPLVREALRIDLDDGVFFAEPAVEDLVDQGRYGGLRIKIPFQIGAMPIQAEKVRKLSRVHFDIGFGDVITGDPERSVLPELIAGGGPISWLVYPIESIYAEKIETVVSRGSLNSRAKDLYDLVLMFDVVDRKKRLISAISATFKNRGTELPGSFSKFFNELDLTVLERSWGSVELSGVKITFAECIGRLKIILAEIDGLVG